MSAMILKDAKRVAKLSFENGKYSATYNGKLLARSQSKEYVINKIRTGDCSRAVELGVYEIEDEHHFITEGAPSLMVVGEEESVEFDINTRFEFLETLVEMIITKQTASALITGEGGLGKTFTVKKMLQKFNLEDVTKLLEVQQRQKALAQDDDDGADDEASPFDRKNPGDFIFVKGYSTAKALYRILFENRDKIVIFDDCDSALKDQNAVNLIKAACDSYDERWVSWYAESAFGGSDLPKSFRFEGQIIFISNMSYQRVDQAIRSRSMCVDLSMNADQKIERMKTIVESDEFLPEVDRNVKIDALGFLESMRYAVRDLTLRSLIQVTKIRNSGKSNWKELAEYIVRTN